MMLRAKEDAPHLCPRQDLSSSSPDGRCMERRLSIRKSMMRGLGNDKERLRELHVAGGHCTKAGNRPDLEGPSTPC